VAVPIIWCEDEKCQSIVTWRPKVA